MRVSDGWGIVTPTSDHDFAGMCKALGVDGYDDPKIATIAARIQYRDEVAAIVDLCYAHAVNLTMAEATARFEAERVPFAMIVSPAELPSDPHAVAVGLFEEFDHHVVGRARLPRHPTRFHETPAQLELASPALGQHTDEILTELGDADRIGDLRERGVVA
jgi:crotonobetainyl-CoA:carnitine CoA-transferase CaiB-like acyl-CoA transferase